VAATFVATAALGLIFTRPGSESYDAKIMLQVTRSMVEDQNFLVADDEFGFNSPHASYGLGMSLLFAVPYTVARVAAGADPVEAANGAMTTNAFVLGLAAVAVLWLARELGLSWTGALVTAALIAGGTMLFPYVASGFSEVAIAVLVALGLLAIAAQRHARPWAALLGGAVAGASALFRADSLLLIFPIVAGGVWLASGRERQALVRLGLGAAPFLLVWAWYNNLRFGSPFKLGYANTDGFNYPFFKGLYGLLLSPGRGLLWYVPLLVAAAVGARWAWRRDPVLTGAAAALLVVRPLFFASWSQWEGGVCWGPRFLVPAMPALAVGVVEVVRRFRSFAVAARVGLVAVVAVSGFVQLVGATVGYEHHWNKVRPVAAERGDVQSYLYAWRYFPIADEAGWLFTRPDLYAGRALPPSRHAVPFTLLLLVGAAAWATAAAGTSKLRKNEGAEALPQGGPDDGRDHERSGVRLLPAGSQD
jgi:hypothetical protein